MKLIDTIAKTIEDRFSINVKSLHKTLYGISDNTYKIVSNDTILYLKIYCENSYQDITSEIELLKQLKENGFNVVEPFATLPIFKINQNYACLFHPIPGHSVFFPTKNQIASASQFLAQFHNFTHGLHLYKRNVLNKIYLNELIMFSNFPMNKEFYTIIKNIDFYDDGILHGDFFPDNIHFNNESISGVMDFSSASNGPFIFDLAIFIMAWCFNNENNTQELIEFILEEYNHFAPKKNYFEDIIPWIKYSILFFLVKRSYLERIQNRQISILKKDLIDKLQKVNQLELEVYESR